MKIKKFLRNWAAPIGCGLFFCFLLRFVLFIGFVPTASMEPTIMSGSLIFGSRIMCAPGVGDIVVFKKDGKTLVKRIAATEGESVTITDTERVVPEGAFYMLGDNAEHSLDSRYWENPFIPEQDIIARVIWP